MGCEHASTLTSLLEVFQVLVSTKRLAVAVLIKSCHCILCVCVCEVCVCVRVCVCEVCVCEVCV